MDYNRILGMNIRLPVSFGGISKTYNETVGVDISKLTIDVHLHLINQHKQFANNAKGFKALLAWIKKHKVKSDEVYFCFEHTGLYSLSLAAFLAEKNILFSMVSGLEVKRSMGVVRGKNDKVDAARIAEYAHLRRDKLKKTVLPSKEVLKIKNLLAIRERMVTQKGGYKASCKEYSSVLKKSEVKVLIHTHSKLIKVLAQEIKEVEAEIMKIIRSDETINNLYKLVTSIKGVGFVLGASLIVTTNCFTAFENARQYACYTGIAPFPFQSGTSIKGNTKVSKMGNQNMKKLLLMGASSARQHDPEIRQYYLKRIEKGKNKMSTLNVIKNKLIHRVFAVVKRGTPYLSIAKYAS
ncbi:IS110 family transposase [Cryomorpha ignava]|uniref:IS110 family transposase n=1 Tax=Cryomorpha ignava TaxID=101383 RepID=A0A7K3WU01_9FLAO|nr:IS110 family transposase [Cryomorpha ignava]NEN24135.1 IS110 family transposase [Cryomorpha ignava]